MAAASPTPQLIQVNKYPNRRLYDQTRSRHITIDELYDLVVAGHTVMVTDSKSGADITNLVLAQALIERTPEKFAAFPPEILHLVIRAGDTMLRSMATGWFTSFARNMGQPVPGAWGGGGGSQGFGWPVPVSTGRPDPAPADAPRQADPVADLQARLEAMMREIANLKSKQE